MGSQGGEHSVVVVRLWQQWLEEQVVPHSCVVDKNWEGHLGREQSQLQARLCSLGFQHQEIKPHNFWL